MKAPMSELVRRILGDRELSKKLMKAIIAERSNPEDVEGRTFLVDGKKFRFVRVAALNKSRD
jgi:hypothetical protein